jgi:hypothetical protein
LCTQKNSISDSPSRIGTSSSRRRTMKRSIVELSDPYFASIVMGANDSLPVGLAS